MVALTPSSFNALGTTAATSAVLYQRNTTVPIGATASDATNIGTLTTNSTQLDVTGQVTPQNQSDYYQFALNGNSLKLNFTNITNSANLRVQITNSAGTVVADNQGTTAQQTAYVEATNSIGLTANAGNYTVKVTYAPTAVTVNPQSYSLSLYSGNHFYSAYETTASPQTSADTPVPVDNTQTYATSDAQLYTTTAYHTIDETATTGVNIGWLYANKSSLSVVSQVTPTDATDYYNFTFEQGSALKLAFNNSTNTSGLRVQLMDSSGTDIIADSNGTTAQKAAYAALTSSNGLNAQNGQYVIKVTYGQDSNRNATQTYNFQLYSGTSYSSVDKTTASAETYGHAVLAGDLGNAGYNAATAAATYLYNQSQGNTTDIMSTLASIASSSLV